MQHRAAGVVCLGLVVALAGSTVADSVVVEASRDNTLYQNVVTDLSNGAGENMHVGLTGDGKITRAILRFDLAGAGIPPGATVTSVVLRLQMNKATGLAGRNHQLHRVAQDWGESTSDALQGEGRGAAAAAGDATWTHTFFSNQFWSTAGGDFAAAASATTSVSTIGVYTWTGAGLTADVQHWLDNPAGNFGWVLMDPSPPASSAKVYASRQNFNAASRPQLTIGYAPPAAPPPPELGPIVLAARLDGAQEVPPRPTDATGVALVSYDRGTRTLTWYVAHSVSNVTVAHIHGPAGEGTNASPVIGFASALSPIRGSTNLTAAQANDLFDGRYYVNVHSTDFPGGAVRGQLLAQAKFAGVLEGQQQVPPVVSAHHGAVHLAYDPPSRLLTYFIQHSITNPSAGHIHGPAGRGANAGILVDFAMGVSPIQGAVVLSEPDAAALQHGFCYVNIHTVANPSGEIRGQLLPVNGVPPATLAATLDAGQQVPPATNTHAGAAVLAYDFGARRLDYHVAHDVSDATLAHIHGPALTGTNAPVLFDLGLPGMVESPLSGSLMLTPSQERDLLSGRYYINIHNPGFMSGAIRGQILPRADFTCVLQGGEETPPLTTREHGVGTFVYDAPSRLLTYAIVHSISNVTAAHIHGPAGPGVAAGVRYPLPAISPITGSVFVAEADVGALLAGRLYVNVHSSDHPAGKIRGQMLPVEAVPRTTHTAIIDGSQEVPVNASTNQGLGLFAYDCASRLVRFEIQHTVTNPIAAHIHGPALAGTNATVVFGFASSNSPIRGVVPLTAPQAADFLAGRYYVNVHSPTSPGGEIRGQIQPALRFTATLQNRQEINHPAVPAMGLGVFDYDATSRVLHYRVEHTVASPSAAHIHGPADPGANAAPVIDFGVGAALQSPITGVATLTVAQATQLLQGRFYVNVHSASFPAGEARGQLVETRPDSDCNGVDDHWEQAYGFGPGGYDAGDDGDGDGHTTAQEYAADTDPTNGASVAAVTLFDSAAATSTVAFATSPLRVYQLQRATNLVENLWLNVGAAFRGGGDVTQFLDEVDSPGAFYRFDVRVP